jgi:hypothetical protein
MASCDVIIGVYNLRSAGMIRPATVFHINSSSPNVVLVWGDIILFFSMAGQPLEGLGRLIFRDFTITHSDTPHSVGLLWTSDQPVAETST